MSWRSRTPSSASSATASSPSHSRVQECVDRAATVKRRRPYFTQALQQSGNPRRYAPARVAPNGTIEQYQSIGLELKVGARVKKSFYLTDTENDLLTSRSKQTGLAETEIIRRA